MWDVSDVCNEQSTFVYVGAALLCAGGLVSYIPQYIELIRSRQPDNISEKSLFILSLSGAALFLNALIFNWGKFDCFSDPACSNWICFANLLGVLQIGINWFVVNPLYGIFVWLKLRNRHAWETTNRLRRWLFELGYILTYLAVLCVALTLSVVEHSRVDQKAAGAFFGVFAGGLGVSAAVGSAVVWIPQIIKLLRNQNASGLSLLMFVSQGIGSIIIVIFQAVLYHQNWTTWLAYVFSFVEQATIVVILIVFRYRGIEPPVDFELSDEEATEISEWSDLWGVLAQDLDDGAQLSNRAAASQSDQEMDDLERMTQEINEITASRAPPKEIPPDWQHFYDSDSGSD
jgi:uncharacterized protein with PQ loop repeat